MNPTLAIVKKEMANTDIKRSLINNIPFFIFFAINAVFKLGTVKQELNLTNYNLFDVVSIINKSQELSVSFSYKLFFAAFFLPSIIYYFIKAFPYIINNFQKGKLDGSIPILFLAPINISHIIFGGSLFATLYIFIISLIGLIPIGVVYLYLGFNFVGFNLLQILLIFLALFLFLLSTNILTNALVWHSNGNPLFIQGLRYVFFALYFFVFYKLNNMKIEKIFNKQFIIISLIYIITTVIVANLLLKRLDKDKLMTSIFKDTI